MKFVIKEVPSIYGTGRALVLYKKSFLFGDTRLDMEIIQEEDNRAELLDRLMITAGKFSTNQGVKVITAGRI